MAAGSPYFTVKQSQNKTFPCHNTQPNNLLQQSKAWLNESLKLLATLTIAPGGSNAQNALVKAELIALLANSKKQAKCETLRILVACSRKFSRTSPEKVGLP